MPSALPLRSDFSFFHGLRVRWSEVDPQGIVFNGNYLTYTDVATTEYYRHLEIRYPADFLRDGGDLFAVKSTLEYLAPARYDDWLELGVRVARLGRSSLTFQIAIWRDGQALTLGELVYVYADGQGRSQPLPTWLRERIRAFEQRPAEE
ncbi:acyl-CoA thioesterase [Pseudomonas panipatensis]|jgi:acyl-CoA thioester hydrolase|uniref:Acyl-CoA thioester hydrolase n=1 Tax=Pseudomonas panipatensis TaxID=428992 RepID=A0A1G8JSV8_9PSED|nr:thioesterase family protein [Pseudomonas panipatensis]SDI34262.1 acyl-CoA thioester hydrolase [Pseudomonas panipatensis]SMP62323.1 acyl-CoA thioester hydrolase [Pseudomonas panipatensis]